MKIRRNSHLIKPELQTQAMFISLAIALSTVSITLVALYFGLSWMLGDEPVILDQLPKALGMTFLIAMVLITPLLLFYVARATQRVAGPAYRMEQYLKTYLRGEEQPPLQLRERDELQILANLLDMALAKKRKEAGQGAIHPDAFPNLLPTGEEGEIPSVSTEERAQLT